MQIEPIGITAVEVVGIEENVLRVRGLDAIDRRRAISKTAQESDRNAAGFRVE